MIAWCGSPFSFGSNNLLLVHNLHTNITYFGDFVEVVESVN